MSSTARKLKLELFVFCLQTGHFLQRATPPSRWPAHNLWAPSRRRQPPVCLLLFRVTFLFVFAAHMCKNSPTFTCVEALIIQIFLFAFSWALREIQTRLFRGWSHAAKSVILHISLGFQSSCQSACKKNIYIYPLNSQWVLHFLRKSRSKDGRSHQNNVTEKTPWSFLQILSPRLKKTRLLDATGDKLGP